MGHTGSVNDSPSRSLSDGFVGGAVVVRPARVVAAMALTGTLFSTGLPTSSATTPEPPGAPQAVYVSPGNESVIVDWDPPASSGTSAITSYQVVGMPEGACAVPASELTCVVTGLTNAVSYTFAVRAESDAGWGPYSQVSAVVVPMPPVPSAPGQVVGRWTDGQTVAVAWASVSGATSYTVTRVDARGAVVLGTFPSSVNTLEPIQVLPGTSGSIQVVANNQHGSSGSTEWAFGPAPYSMSATPIGAPPGNVAITPDGATVYVGGGYVNGDPVRLFRTSDGTVVDTLGVSGNRVDLSADGATLLVSSYTTTYVVATATKDVVATISAPAQYSALSPDGSTAYLLEDRTLRSFDATSGSLIATATVLSPARGLEVAPDGARVVALGFSMPFSVLTVLPPDLSTTSNLVVAGYFSQIAFGSNSLQIFAARYLSSVVEVIDIGSEPPTMVRSFAGLSGADGVLPLDGGARLAVGAFFEGGQPMKIVDTLSGAVTSTGVFISRDAGIRSAAISPAGGRAYMPGIIAGDEPGLMFTFRRTPESNVATVEAAHGGGATTISWTVSSSALQPRWYAVSINEGQRTCSIPAVSGQGTYSCTFVNLPAGTPSTARVMAVDAEGPWLASSLGFVTPTVPPAVPDPGVAPTPVVLPRLPSASAGVGLVAGREDPAFRDEVDRDRGVKTLSGSGYTVTVGSQGNDSDRSPVDSRGVLGVRPGGDFEFRGAGFSGPGIDVFLDPPIAGGGAVPSGVRSDSNSTVHLGTLTVDGQGVATGSIRVPATTSPGDHALQLVGTTAAGERLVLATIIAVVAQPSQEVGIRVTGARGQGASRGIVTFTGTSEGLSGRIARPWIRLPGEPRASMSKARVRIGPDGTFVWTTRRMGAFSAYFTVGDVRSNRVLIRPR